MKTIHDISELRAHLEQKQHRVALVPTMGNLHAGHIHLVELAKQHAQCVVVSIFVNPLQFGANEDLASYPRTLAEDCAKLQAAGVDIVFAPTEKEMYPVPQTIVVEPPPIASDLCGASRPGHFRGMATVVLKLFNIVQPQVAIFGKKDFQQLFIIRALVQQMNLPIEIVAGETMREHHGLALSSRNGYLSSAERAKAVELQQALQQVVRLIRAGQMHYADAEQQAAASLRNSGWNVDYISIRSVHNLLPPGDQDSELVVLGAARLGNTRLIDNLEFKIA